MRLGYTIWKTITSSLETLSFEWEVRRLHHLERGRWDHFRGRSRAVPLEGLLESSMETEALKWGAVGVGRAADNYTSRSGPGT